VISKPEKHNNKELYSALWKKKKEAQNCHSQEKEKTQKE
jgi:hypothetical protein